MEGQTKQCQNCKLQFLIEPEDFAFYKKIDVPPPTWCPQCRLERRLIWRNENNLYRRPDSLTGKEIFSEFPKEVEMKIYDEEYWRSDAWDPKSYARDYDFYRSFFEQFHDLLYESPWPSRSVIDLVNSDYCAQAGNIKNCYLTFNADTSENILYSVRIAGLKDCVDILDAGNSELCYGSTFFLNCFKAFFSYDCWDSREIWCSKDLVGCSNCVGCVNLRQRSYCIFNVQYSKEQYAVEFAKLKLDTYTGLRSVQQRVAELEKELPVRFLKGFRNTDSSGDCLHDTKNCKECWGVNSGQDLRYCQMVYRGVTDSYDYTTWGNGANLLYECQTCGSQVSSLKFCWECWPSCQRLEYSINCRSSSDLFGCVGLKKAQYCILNKQYAKEEYESLVPMIKQHMKDMPFVDGRGRVYGYGEFFPTAFSPYAYNESQLHSLFPLGKDEAEAKGYIWRDTEKRNYQAKIKASELPDNIVSVDDSILEQMIECPTCTKAYRIVPRELQFLKQHSIPLPRECHTCRFTRRAKLINPPLFYSRQCAKCQAPFRTSYAPDRPEIVYCEQCYQQEVV